MSFSLNVFQSIRLTVHYYIFRTWKRKTDDAWWILVQWLPRIPWHFKLAWAISWRPPRSRKIRVWPNMATVNSLRTKSRGAQSLPRRQSIHPGMNEGSTQPLPPPPRVRPKDKSKVESLMKRRYSTRGVPPPSALEPFPSELSNKSEVADSSYGDKVNVVKWPVLTAAEWSKSPKIRQHCADEPRFRSGTVHRVIPLRSIGTGPSKLLWISPRPSNQHIGRSAVECIQ